VIAVQRNGGEALSIHTIFEEAHEGDGAVFGIVAALRHARAKSFILAVDYPLVTSELLRTLRDSEAVPLSNDRPQPLCAVWDVALLPRLEERIAARVYDLRGVLQGEMIDGGEAVMNVNTPEDWKRAEGLLASR
jgi:molybdopterin-guanine dinucleotide biosynthesis protein A